MVARVGYAWSRRTIWSTVVRSSMGRRRRVCGSREVFRRGRPAGGGPCCCGRRFHGRTRRSASTHKERAYKKKGRLKPAPTNDGPP